MAYDILLNKIRWDFYNLIFGCQDAKAEGEWRSWVKDCQKRQRRRLLRGEQGIMLVE